jgi:hypothetical protein
MSVIVRVNAKPHAAGGALSFAAQAAPASKAQ